jgi:hypothetical protein
MRDGVDADRRRSHALAGSVWRGARGSERNGDADFRQLCLRRAERWRLVFRRERVELRR